MRILVTGGPVFIGRWGAGRLLHDGHQVWVNEKSANSEIDNVKDISINALTEQWIKETKLKKGEVEHG